MPEPVFVRSSGIQFSLNDQAFRVAGANNYYLGFESDSMVMPVLDLAVQMGLNTIRTWAFLDCASAVSGSVPPNAKDGVFFQYLDSTTGSPAYNDGPNGLERLDRTIFLAEEKGLRLILPLVNYWDDFGGVNQYLQWFGLTGRDQFYRNAEVKKAYRNCVEHILLRVNTRTGRQYRDEPAILAWELINEPRCVDASGSPLSDGIDTLLGWVDEMSSFVRSLDPNHLIGVCHLYPDYSPAESPNVFGARWIREHIESGERANKPMIIEEYGLKIDSGAAAREVAYETWLEQVISSQGAGALVWMIASTGTDGRPCRDYDLYTIYSADDAPAVRRFALTQPRPDMAAGSVSA
jgi:mannan endo-1,4-beta-mannosidase